MAGKLQDSLTRIAIVNADRCKPKKCQQECKKVCPVVRIGKLCIEVDAYSVITKISEPLCIGCGLCVRKCPFEAISIVNLPTNLSKDTTHRYGPNSFKLHRLPQPNTGRIMGLIGANGTGKSTALRILANEIKPNLGNYEDPPSWAEIIKYFRGSSLQNYFTKMLENSLKAEIKPQYVDQIPKYLNGTVGSNLSKINESENILEIINEFDLTEIQTRDLSKLSGGELQRFACAITCLRKNDVYMFDEPSSYLDVKQRLKVANRIRDMVRDDRYIIVVEHDLSILDYISDYVCCLYGSPGHYGVVTHPSGVGEGINNFLEGFIPSENLRFREKELSFNISEKAEEELIERNHHYSYPSMKKKFEDFELNVDAGSFSDSEIIVLLGENGTGKTTLIRLLAGNLEPDENEDVPTLNVSYKPQKITPKFKGSVHELLMKRIQDAALHPQFINDVIKPLNVNDLMDKEVQYLSGGELQRVALTICLGKPADIYLIDEPSAYLDSEQRLHASKVIRRFVRNTKKTAFVVEHDFLMATYLADRIIVFEGTPSVKATATTPQSLLTGMNSFLKILEVTFRRDRNNYRPRINRKGSSKDVEQKKSGNYFFIEY